MNRYVHVITIVTLITSIQLRALPWSASVSERYADPAAWPAVPYTNPYIEKPLPPSTCKPLSAQQLHTQHLAAYQSLEKLLTPRWQQIRQTRLQRRMQFLYYSFLAASAGACCALALRVLARYYCLPAYQNRKHGIAQALGAWDNLQQGIPPAKAGIHVDWGLRTDGTSPLQVHSVGLERVIDGCSIALWYITSGLVLWRLLARNQPDKQWQREGAVDLLKRFFARWPSERECLVAGNGEEEAAHQIALYVEQIDSLYAQWGAHNGCLPEEQAEQVVMMVTQLCLQAKHVGES